MSTPTAIDNDVMPLVQVKNLSRYFSGPGGQRVVAVNDVSLTINQGEVLGVVGESGCGKSTLGHSLLRLIEPSSGDIVYAGRDVTALDRSALKSLRKDVQIVFQDPFGALNPQHRVEHIVAEPLTVHRLGNRQQRAERVGELLEMVGLPVAAGRKYVHEFSGGQRQRIAIARALASNPSFLVCDEAVSALDVSVQSQILNLLMDLQKRLNLTMMFISHDLSVIRHISDRVAVMYLGKIIETAPTAEIMDRPKHPYTRALLSAIPHPLQGRAARILLHGELPDPANIPSGCIFHTRCPERESMADNRCIDVVPELVNISSDCRVACHLRLLELEAQ